MSIARVSIPRARWRKPLATAGATLVLAFAGVVAGVNQTPAQADSGPVLTSTVRGADGKNYFVTNHFAKGLSPQSLSAPLPDGQRHEWLLVWAGDQNAADINSHAIKNWPLTVDTSQLPGEVSTALPGQDFLAVIDATKGSPTYGKVVNTATVGPLVENEPHHMEYIWHKGNKIYAGGLFSSATYVFSVNSLPEVTVSGVSLPTQTLGGSIPDAFWVLKDGTAYGTYMGGPVVPGPYVYSDGKVRTGNGYGGTPGEVVHFNQNGQVLGQYTAATSGAEDPSECVDLPDVGNPSCANPHGIQVRQDLGRMVTSDFAEPRNIILNPLQSPSPDAYRPTVRLWDISNENDPKVISVSELPKGPRTSSSALYDENRGAMETTVTNLPQHKGAFAETMNGGAIYYTPDITKSSLQWRLVFDDTKSQDELAPNSGDAEGDNGGWLQTSPDDKFLFHAVMGRLPGTLGTDDPGSPGYIVTLNIQKLLASGDNPACDINTIDQVYSGGKASDCPAIAGLQELTPAGDGPHWGALDNFSIGSDGYYHETSQVTRIATSNYFVARTGLDGNHKVCILNVNPATGALSLDTTFRDENEGTPCVDFNRLSWPQGDTGDAKPHSELFVVADNDVK